MKSLKLFSMVGAMVMMCSGVVSAHGGDVHTTPTESTEHSVVSPMDKTEWIKQLAKVRRVTAKYHDVAVAEADGYKELSPNVVVPGLGTMGIHYINMDLLSDGGVIDPLKPEAILYIPTANGGRKLVGVEYIVSQEEWEAAHPDGEKPSVFGQVFEGPMAGHDPEGREPVHYDKHVWLWRDNPHGKNEPQWPASPGMFSQYNPSIK